MGSLAAGALGPLTHFWAGYTGLSCCWGSGLTVWKPSVELGWQRWMARWGVAGVQGPTVKGAGLQRTKGSDGGEVAVVDGGLIADEVLGICSPTMRWLDETTNGLDGTGLFSALPRVNGPLIRKLRSLSSWPFYVNLISYVRCSKSSCG